MAEIAHMQPQEPHVPLTDAEDLALLVESIQDYAIFLLDPAGQIRSWNPGAERLMGYEAEEAIGKNFSMFYGPEDLENEKPSHELETAEAERRIEDEGWRIRKDGTRFWANTVITVLRNDDGTVRGFAKITRDLTRRREAEERVRQSEEMFRLLVGSVKDYAIFLLDPTGHIATWNEGAHRMKGYEPHEIIGKHFSTFYPEIDIRNGKPERELKDAREHGSVEDEGWRVRKDGTLFWANVVITAVFDETGELRGFAKVTRDITDRKRAEELQRSINEQREARFHAEEERRRAEASYRAAQEANRAKDEFLMTLSHELRTPMTAILGWARVLPTLSVDDEGFRDALASIARSAQLQARLIDDVLDVSRIVSGKLRLTIESIDAKRMLASAIDAVRPSADAKGITIANLASDSLGAIVADPTRLQQVIWNLLTNAVKFTPRKGIITVSGRRTTSHVEITVTDSGEGIEPSFLPHIFEPFRQAESPSTRVHGGLGLGLSIVRYIAEAHGGTVSAESRGRGLGATFTVTLPIRALAASPPAGTAVASAVVSPSRDRLAGMSILLVDDEREGRLLVRAVLQQAGANVVAVDSAEHALNALAERVPDIIITDIAMPLMDGYAFARGLREMPQLHNVKIVALSAFPAGSGASLESGFDEYLSKPIEPAHLVETIAKLRSAA
ncbi:MAG TPA: PAS domain S-box protein [Thermoanaerobaculia bacterium]|nr:PAS domain S-box protein [Thermoanaerobaculia bacterium]